MARDEGIEMAKELCSMQRNLVFTVRRQGTIKEIDIVALTLGGSEGEKNVNEMVEEVSTPCRSLPRWGALVLILEP